MTGIPFGAIVLTDFPFTDLTAAKRRPALVISTDNDRRTDMIVAYITSIARNGRDAMPIAPTATNGLKVPSFVRFDKIATINRAIITGRIGNAEPIWLADARKIFFGVFGFGTPGNRFNARLRNVCLATMRASPASVMIRRFTPPRPTFALR